MSVSANDAIAAQSASNSFVLTIGYSTLQISSASLNDPSSGDIDLDLPAQSVESVEVLANPFAAEYGRFTSSITQVRTRRGTNDWEIKPGNLVPRFRKDISGVRAFEPRFSVRGPLKRDRAFIAQDFQFRYLATPVKSYTKPTCSRRAVPFQASARPACGASSWPAPAAPWR